MMPVRVRFAPSPTGPLHMGGVRTALFNYLFAKKNNGTFILRIEDTDQSRYVHGTEEYIQKSLEWCGIVPDEGQGYSGDYGPYKQSERKEIYKKYVQQLIDSENAYYAFDTAEELDALRKEHEAEGKTFTYNYLNRTHLKTSLKLSKEEVQSLLDSNTPFVVRFKVPADKSLKFTDLIRGKMNVDTSTLDDKVLFKSDGLPTYHMANIVDDYLMRISHVIRGEEWLPSLPLHILMYDAFGWQKPQFAHLPLILKPEGKGKLSKRDGEKHGFPVFPLEWETDKGTAKGYKEEGYFPEAFINMLALLGWNPGSEQEIFSLEELVNSFDLNKVSKSGARFSPDKAIWFNNQYLQKLPDAILLKEFQEVLKNNQVQINDEFDLKVALLMKERANFIHDIWENGKFFYSSPKSYDEKGFKKVWKEDTKSILEQFISINQNTEKYTADAIQHEIKNFVNESGLGFGKIMMPLRLSLVGALQGPDIPVLMELLGKNEVENRILAFIKFAEQA